MKLSEKLIKILEMAQIGSDNGFSFWVYKEPLKAKSIHIKFDNSEIVYDVSKQVVLEIKRLDKSKYNNISKNKPLPQSIAKPLEDFLNSKNNKQTKLTNREAFELLWASLNP